MNNFNRVKDLTEVFDEKWKANHSVDVNKAREKEKQFNDRMFGKNNVFKKDMDNSVGGRVDRLQQKINNANEASKMSKFVNFKNNFR